VWQKREEEGRRRKKKRRRMEDEKQEEEEQEKEEEKQWHWTRYTLKGMPPVTYFLQLDPTPNNLFSWYLKIQLPLNSAISWELST
jgi:hypothetical protein